MIQQQHSGPMSRDGGESRRAGSGDVEHGDVIRDAQRGGNAVGDQKVVVDDDDRDRRVRIPRRGLIVARKTWVVYLASFYLASSCVVDIAH